MNDGFSKRVGFRQVHESEITVLTDVPCDITRHRWTSIHYNKPTFFNNWTMK